MHYNRVIPSHILCFAHTMLYTSQLKLHSACTISLQLEYMPVSLLTWHDLRYVFSQVRNESVAVMLMNAGAPVNVRSIDIDNVFHDVVLKKWYSAGQLLIRLSGFQPYYRPLGEACMYGNYNLVVDMLRCGADIHIENDVSLKWAVNRDQKRVVKYLLDTYTFCNRTLNACARTASVHNMDDVTSWIIDNHRRQLHTKLT